MAAPHLAQAPVLPGWAPHTGASRYSGLNLAHLWETTAASAPRPQLYFFHPTLGCSSTSVS